MIIDKNKMPESCGCVEGRLDHRLTAPCDEIKTVASESEWSCQSDVGHRVFANFLVQCPSWSPFQQLWNSRDCGLVNSTHRVTFRKVINRVQYTEGQKTKSVTCTINP